MAGTEMEKIAHKHAALLVWDSDGTPPAGDWKVVLWRGFAKADEPAVVSVPTLVEEQADTLRGRYLAWVHELGEKEFDGKRLVDRLELRPGFSFWWMTLLAQKFNASGSSQVDNAIKSLAFEGLIRELEPASVSVVSPNDRLAATLQELCQKRGVPFRREGGAPAAGEKTFAKRSYDSLPSTVRALVSFAKYLFNSNALLREKKETAPALSDGITFVDILVHLDKRAIPSGRFFSNYWTALVEELLGSQAKTNWLHNYFRHEAIPSPLDAYRLVRRFNENDREVSRHTLMEQHLSPSVLLKGVRDFFRISSASRAIGSVREHFQVPQSDLNFWTLLEQEWNNSLTGPDALHYCLRVSLYEKVFSSMPRQRLGIYIQENQPWEMALIHAWRSSGHGRLIGIPHTTVRFWDLRYFYDARSYRGTRNNALPLPDLVAVNGPVARKLYLDGGYPESQLLEVEALRYLHLLNRAQDSAGPGKSAFTIVACGDFLSSSTNQLVSWLETAAQSLPPDTSYILKPHPACPVRAADFPSIKLQMTDAPLNELFGHCDLVLTSNVTSAAVDAYCWGLPVVQMLTGNTFNMSPLRGLQGVRYATNPTELAEALGRFADRESAVDEDYFHLDAQLPRWRQMLGLPPGQI